MQKGFKHSEESKQKMRDTRIARGHSMSGEKNPMYGKKHTQETLNKISESQKMAYTEERRRRLKELKTGLRHTEASKKKMSESRKGEKNWNYGRHLSEETKRKIGAVHRGNKYFLGKTHTVETRKKIVLANTGKKQTKEAKEHMRIAQTGRKHTLATRLKMSENNRGEKSNFWSGGTHPLYKLLRKGLKNKVWRESVFLKNNYTCALCSTRSAKGNPVVLNADHIKPFAIIFMENNLTSIEQALCCDDLWDVDNGQTLCRPCHKEKTKIDTIIIREYKRKQLTTNN